LGWGDFSIPWKVTSNSLVSDGNIPSMHGGGENGMRVRHKEFLGPIYSQTSFTNKVFYVNPGLQETFPWLAGVAANFQQYKIHGLVMVYKPALPDGIVSFSSLGNVVIISEENVNAPAYTSQIQMEQTQFCASAKPTEPIVAPVECKSSLIDINVKQIRSGSVPTGGTQQMYDFCQLQVATTGQTTANVLMGNLYLSYDISLLNPAYGGILSIDSASYLLTGCASATPLGIGQVKGFDSIGLTFNGATGTVVTFPIGSVGTYLAILRATCASGAITLPTQTCVNITEQKVFDNHGSAYPYAPALTGETSTKICDGHLFSITDPSVVATITFSGATFPTVTYADYFVTAVNPNVA